MSFKVRLGFCTEADQAEFAQKSLARLPGSKLVEPEESEEIPASDPDSGVSHWTSLIISSPLAARELCHSLTALVVHRKTAGVLIEWTGVEGEAQSVMISGKKPGDAEMAAMRLSTSMRLQAAGDGGP